MTFEELRKLYDAAETKAAIYEKALQEAKRRSLRREIKAKEELIKVLKNIDNGDTFYCRNSLPLEFIGTREVMPSPGSPTYFCPIDEWNERYKLIRKETVAKRLLEKISHGETIVLWEADRKFSELEFSKNYQE